MRKFLFVITLFATCSLVAQQLEMGGWRTHLAYTSTKQIATAADKVYGVSGGALYAVDKDDESVELLSKITGLNDNTIVSIAYSEQQKTLVVAYANSNIDLIADNGTITNISDLYNKNMAGSKLVNSIFCDSKYAYFCCDFGIMVLDIARNEVADTYVVGSAGSNVPVLDMIRLDDTFYALTNTQVLQAPVSGKNLANFENWSAVSGVPTTAENTKIITYNNAIYLLQTDSTVYKFANSATWNKIYEHVLNIDANDDYMYVSYPVQLLTISTAGSQTTNHAGICNAYRDNATSTTWCAASDAGIARITADGTNLFCPNGSALNQTWRIRYANGRMFVVNGGRWASQYERAGYVMIYDANNTWTNINPYGIMDQTGRKVTDFVDIAIDPADNKHFFVASYGMGIYEFRNDKFYRLHNGDNSGVESIYPTRKPEEVYYNYHRVDGLKYDDEGNLWFLNPGTTATIKCMLQANATRVAKYAYSAINNVATPQDIVISNANKKLKWVLVPRNTGSLNTALFAFYDNGTTAIDDDQTRFFESLYDQDGNRYAPSNFRCIAQDQDNHLWIGSSDGIITIQNQTKVFDENFTATRIKIPRNDGTNLADYLLDGVQINDIVVDGSNRKWIATETNGVFLVSDDGLETIHHFTSENSPLLSNQVQTIGINEKTGEVFFGTGTGLCSYQSDASEGNEQFTNVHAFPNPVREDFDGVITITGLVTDARVKITDVAGNVVYETISNGGIAVWDGCRANGQRVATGIYLAMCFSPDGKQHETTKILIINK